MKQDFKFGQDVFVKGERAKVIHKISDGFWELDFNGLWITVQESLINKTQL